MIRFSKLGCVALLLTATSAFGSAPILTCLEVDDARRDYEDASAAAMAYSAADDISAAEADQGVCAQNATSTHMVLECQDAYEQRVKEARDKDQQLQDDKMAAMMLYQTKSLEAQEQGLTC